MLLVGSAQPPTAALAAIECSFLSPEDSNVIVNKLNRLEVYTLVEGHLRLSHEIPVFSSIGAVASVHLKGRPTATLVVLTTSLDLFTLDYDPDTSPGVPFVTTSTTSIHEQHGRLAAYTAILVDPALRSIIVHAYSGLVRVVPIKGPDSGRRGSKSARRSSVKVEASEKPRMGDSLDVRDGFNLRLPALNVDSMAFVPPLLASEKVSAAIALVHVDHHGQKVLKTFQLDLKDKELSPGPLTDITLPDPGSEYVIPVQAPEEREKGRGLLVIGEEHILWCDADSDGLASPTRKGKELPSTPSSSARKGKGKESTRQVSCQLPVSQVRAWTAVQGDADSFLLGDLYGKLYLLKVTRLGTGKVERLDIQDLGDASSSSALVSLSDNLLFVASRYGDSQLLRLSSDLFGGKDGTAMQTGEDEGPETVLELVASFTCLAPILDCRVIGTDRSVPQVVTCSGAYKGGSLRIVRQGVGFDEQARIEVPDVESTWYLDIDGQSTLVLSSITQTTVVQFSGSDEDGVEIEEVELAGFDGSKPTLCAATLAGGRVVQVTQLSVNVHVGGVALEPWLPGSSRKVTAATVSNEHIVLALAGGEIALLAFQGDQLVEVTQAKLANEIAALTVTQIGDLSVALVALWSTHDVLLYSLPELELKSTQALETDDLIRSLAVATLAGSTRVFVGLGNGSLLETDVIPGSLQLAPFARKGAAIGRRPIAKLQAFEQEGVVRLFAACDRPTIVSAKDRLSFSSLNLPAVSTVAVLGGAAFPSSLALATSEGIIIGRVDTEQKLDIKTVVLNDLEPRRLDYASQAHIWGVGCVSRHLNRATGEQAIESVLNIYEDDSFDLAASLPIDERGEEITSVISLPLEWLGTKNMTEDTDALFVVGTQIPGKENDYTGRLLLVTVNKPDSQGQRETQCLAMAVPGPVMEIAVVGDRRLAVALDPVVSVYKVDLDITPLTKVADWSGAFSSYALAAQGGHIVVGDALRSITLLKDGTGRLEEVARDYHTYYMTAVESLADPDDGTSLPTEFIGAEGELNLFTVERDTNPASTDNSLSPRAMFHLGESVTRFRRGSLLNDWLHMSQYASPRLLYATSAGSIGVIAELKSRNAKILADLERNMRRVLKSAGGLEQESWRAFKTTYQASPSVGFVDGDFIQRFLSLAPDDIEAVLAGGSDAEKLKQTAEELSRIVEDVGKLH